jgi:plasmid segregation protein ParM
MKVETVDLLVVGLPVSQYTTKRAALQKAMTGTFDAGRKQRIVVRRALVVPQPQGALYWCAQQNPSVASPRYKTLVMDVGSRTFDWLVTRGMRVVPNMSDSVTRGVSDILRHIADTVGARIKEDFRDLDAVDRALRTGQLLRLNQQDHDLKKFDTAVRKIADQALDFVLARLDGPQDLEHIILVGGGAYLYTKAVRHRFPKHKITEVADPMYTNVRGFQLLGEQYVRERPDLFRADAGTMTSEAPEPAQSQ